MKSSDKPKALSERVTLCTVYLKSTSNPGIRLFMWQGPSHELCLNYPQMWGLGEEVNKIKINKNDSCEQD